MSTLKSTSTERATEHLIDLYRKAAGKVENGTNNCSLRGCRASCCALWRSAVDDEDLGNEAVNKYREFFLHSNDEPNGWWNREMISMEHEGARVLALLLMAEMIESGDA